MEQVGEKFCQFVDACPTPHQFGAYCRKILSEAGYTELNESEQWTSIPEKGFVLREEKALIAFQNGGLDEAMIVATHCDSPVLVLEYANSFNNKSNIVKATPGFYGGGIWPTFYDRGLRLAGSVQVNIDGQIQNRLFDSVDPIGVIPTPAELTYDFSNKLQKFDVVVGLKGTDIREYIAKELAVSPDQIVYWNLCWMDAEPASIVSHQFISSPRIDNLGSTFAGLEAFLNSKPNGTFNILAVFDNEEIGSNTNCGARSNFLPSFIERIVPKSKIMSFVSRSLCVSADNAHAQHPNWAEIHESLHNPHLGGGFCLKKSPGSNYATDMNSEIPLQSACKKLSLPLNSIINRNDKLGGSTLGPMIAVGTGISTVDVGQAQLAMHSCRELVTIKDVEDNIKIFQELYNNYEEHRLKL